MSAPAYLKNWQLSVMPIFERFAKWHHSSGKVDLTDHSAPDTMFSCRRRPVVFGGQVNCLMRQVRSDLGLVRVPVLIMQGRCDRTIAADSGQGLYEGLATRNKEIVWWSHSGHAITVDSEREAVWARSYAFIVAHGAAPRNANRQA